MNNRIHSHIRDDNIGLRKRNLKLYSKSSETNYLSAMGAVFYIDEPKELFKFEHPNLAETIDNSRHDVLNFKAKLDSVLHGFAGYFTSKLYNEIKISIHPNSHTQGMASWYPIYFPIEQPTFVKKGGNIKIEIWRKCNPSQVWYEWQVNDGPVANVGGEIHPIYL
jgi:type II protein arginine methyltransferase